jgi:hypothetical protein
MSNPNNPYEYNNTEDLGDSDSAYDIHINTLLDQSLVDNKLKTDKITTILDNFVKNVFYGTEPKRPEPKRPEPEIVFGNIKLYNDYLNKIKTKNHDNDNDINKADIDGLMYDKTLEISEKIKKNLVKDVPETSENKIPTIIFYSVLAGKGIKFHYNSFKVTILRLLSKIIFSLKHCLKITETEPSPIFEQPTIILEDEDEDEDEDKYIDIIRRDAGELVIDDNLEIKNKLTVINVIDCNKIPEKEISEEVQVPVVEEKPETETVAESSGPNLTTSNAPVAQQYINNLLNKQNGGNKSTRKGGKRATKATGKKSKKTTKKSSKKRKTVKKGRQSNIKRVKSKKIVLV